MGRLQLVELEDLAWWPAPVRNGATDWLGVGESLTELPYRRFVRMLSEGLRHTGDTHLVDLCSGGGGPLPLLMRMLREREGLPVTATLTDLYPNAHRLQELALRDGGGIDVAQNPVNAMDVPAALRGFRIMCNSFHHFRPAQAHGILADAVAKRQGIAILELVERSPRGLLLVLLAFIGGTLGTPFIRPFKLSRLVLSWVLPLIPFNLLFDGLVSCLRVYSVEELRALVRAIPASDGYRWEIQRLLEGPLAFTVLIGVPERTVGLIAAHPEAASGKLGPDPATRGPRARREGRRR